MSNKIAILALVIAVAALGTVVLRPTGNNAPLPEKKEIAFERVMREETIRCGYFVYSPALMKDSKTGELSGLSYDLLMQIGKTLGLKIDWAEEVTVATALEGLKTNRYDMICTSLYWRPNLMRYAELVQPYYYLPINVIQRKGETRFKSADDINRPEIKIGGIDGTIPMLIEAEDFKNAISYSLPETTPYSENLLSVAAGKADVTFLDSLVFYTFDKNNPGQLEIDKSIPPLRVFANTFAVLKGEHDLSSMLSNAIIHLLNNGKVDQIISKYEPVPGAIMRVAPPYVSSEKS